MYLRVSTEALHAIGHGATRSAIRVRHSHHHSIIHSFTPSESDTGTTYVQNMSTFSTIFSFFFVIVKWMKVAMRSKNKRGKNKQLKCQQRMNGEKKCSFFSIPYFYLNFLALFVFFCTFVVTNGSELGSIGVFFCSRRATT